MKPSASFTKSLLLTLFTAALLFMAAPAAYAAGEKGAPGAPEAALPVVPSAGTKVWVGEEYYFIHEFDKNPALGPLVLKIRLFRKDGTRTGELAIKGSSDMPSMRGAHDTGLKAFHISKKGDYLLPVNIVMPGDWEVKILVYSGETLIFSGRILFDV